MDQGQSYNSEIICTEHYLNKMKITFLTEEWNSRTFNYFN